MKKSSVSENNTDLNSGRLILFAALVSVITIAVLFPYHSHGHVMAWDMFGYYLYLPEIFIYRDPGIHSYDVVKEINNTYQLSETIYQIHEGPLGNYVIQYPIGMALLLLPSFFVGYQFASIFNYPIDGFSEPFQQAIIVETFIITFIGLWYLGKLMMFYLKERTAAILILVCVFTTNFWSQAYYAIPSVHIYIFSLAAVLLYYLHQYIHSGLLKNIFISGFLLGMSIITRFTEAIWILPVAFLVLTSRFSFQKRSIDLILLLFISGLVVSIQFIYWKLYTGEYLYYSYRNAGEGFEFLEPNTVNFLFSFRKGWFVYTPLMLLLGPGLFKLFKSNQKLGIMITLFLVANIYLLSSWSCWYYAGSFGQRGMIESYPLLLIPIGLFIEPFHKRWSLVLIFILTYLNLFQSWQHRKGIIHPSNTTISYYWRVFGRTSIPEGASQFLLVRKSANRADDTFQDSSNYYVHHDYQITSSTIQKKQDPSIFQISDKQVYTSNFKLSYKQLFSENDHGWIQIHGNIHSLTPDSILELKLVMGFKNKYGEDYDYQAISVPNITGNYDEKNNRYINYTFLSPEVRSMNDSFFIYFWKTGKGSLFVNDLSIRSYIKK